MSEPRPPLEEIEQFFEGLAGKGDSHAGVGWPTIENQTIRFDAALRLIEPGAEGFTVNDFGCGLAHMYDYMKAKGLPMKGYRGYDLSERSLAVARERLGSEVELIRSDHLTGQADYSFACGIFNTRLDATDEEWLAFMKSVVLDLHEHSTRGFAFSSLSTYVDWREPQLYYADPMEMFTFCKEEVSPRVALLHDYPIYEWTMLVRRPEVAPGP
jgi:SAM-dependent methyltransferase